MKKALNALSFVKKRFIYPASLYTILIALLFMIIASGDMEQPSITLGLLACIFAYSVVIAITTLLLDSKKINAIVKYIIHYAINVAAFVGFWQLCYPQSVGARADQYNLLVGRFIWEISMQRFIVGICFFSLVYLVVIGIGLAKKALTGKDTEKQAEEEYKSIF